MGFVVFMVMGVYLLISLGVVTWAVSHAKKNGLSVKKWGWGAALVMYMIPFWDWIPTVAVHQYYCSKDSGFWVYKTLEQWKAENPGGMEGLEEYSVWKEESGQYGTVAKVNQRFSMVYANHLTTISEGKHLFNRWRWEHKLIDNKTNEVMARRIDFSTGNGFIGGEPELRFWLHSDHCPGHKNMAKKFGDYLKQFKGAEK
ncbi:MAG: hypothetical protein A2100_04545 [Sideroxydans sp. GWF2_59_14]|nr:MAG: hypothetical protein A2100_04545 [Sideroxydans sp. GWF2_59_14]HAF44593.1 hypothetical protein [Gallionellaceae bacterium]